MAYSKEIYDLAYSELEERKSAAFAEKAKRLEQIKRTAPELFDTEERIKNTFFELTMQIIGKEGNAEEAVERIKQENMASQKQLKEGLKAHGFPENYLDTPYFCSRCMDTGSVEGKACDCFKTLLRKYSSRELNKDCTIALHDFKEINFGLYDPKDVDRMKNFCGYLKNYTDRFTTTAPVNSLLVFGGTGTGKTLYTSCVAKALIERGFAVCFGTSFELIGRIEDEHFGRKSGDTVGTVLGCDLLIIDDMGAEFRSKFSESTLYNILNSRMNMDKPTIISMNMPLKELKTNYNERIASRIMGYYKPLMFTCEDIRLKLAMSGTKL